MSPNTENEDELTTVTEEITYKFHESQADKRQFVFVYRSILTQGYLHLAGLYGLYLCFTSVIWATIVLNCILFMASNLGVTAGAHRLWSHRSYKAKLPLQIILMTFQTLAFQNTVMTWARDHRTHHKFSDTDADPHNATRGFFFSHIGWLLVRGHPEVKKKGKTVDMSDIYSNPVLIFQKKYAVPFIVTISFILPTVIPIYFWGESLSNSWHVNIFRYAFSLNTTFLINSAAHAFGYRPYEKSIRARQNMWSNILTFGEGFHNYHHIFPWDYRASEFGNNYGNLTTKFIDFFAWIGWAYDLKTASEDIVIARSKRTGDGTDLWGRKNKDM